MTQKQRFNYYKDEPKRRKTKPWQWKIKVGDTIELHGKANLITTALVIQPVGSYDDQKYYRIHGYILCQYSSGRTSFWMERRHALKIFKKYENKITKKSKEAI
jgi:hypothetical protein